MINGAIIGVGKIAQECHLPAFTNKLISSRAKIVAAADVNEASIRQAEILYPELRYYSTAKELYENEELDFVDICTPPAFHYQALQEAIQRGFHIICEKPFVASSKDAENIYDLIVKSSITFMPCHQYRYSSVWQTFKGFIEEEKQSGSLYLQFNVFRTEADKGLPVLNNVWRINPEVSGGGILSDTGVHYLYLVLWMLGIPNSVTVRTFNLKDKGHNVEDTAAVILEFEKAVAEINLTWAADRRANTARIIGSDSSLSYDGKCLLRYENNSSYQIPVDDLSDKSNYIGLYAALFNDFLNCVEREERQSEMLLEALEVVNLLNLCYISARHKKTIELDVE